MSNHTPGPWTLSKKNGRVIECNGCKISVAASTPADSPVAWANARLIAAAPDLLRLLKEALCEQQKDRCVEDWLRDARIAIAKAEGTP